MSPEVVLDLRPVITLGLMFLFHYCVLVSINYLIEMLLSFSWFYLNMGGKSFCL